MSTKNTSAWRLGLFIITGLAIFTAFIYFIGKQKNLFGSTFRLRSEFRNVSGLKVGNHIRLAGINIGTVDDITLITDSSVLVVMVIRKSVQPHIKKDTRASIGSDGLMGDKVLTLVPGIPDGTEQPVVKNNDIIPSNNGIEMDDIMKSIKSTVENAGIISRELAVFTLKMNKGDGVLTKLISDEAFSNDLKATLAHLEASSGQFEKFTQNMNNGKGALSKLVSDESFGKALDSTMVNLQSSTKGLSENMEAAQHNFLLRGFFNKKKKAEAKKASVLLAAAKKQQKITADSIRLLQGRVITDSLNRKNR